MPCYHPLRMSHLAVPVGCGQCIGCRLERSRQWAVRCMHEASLHDENCFITLTYREADLPIGGTLVPEDARKFIKNLRQRIWRKDRLKRLSFFLCGEYGEQLSRPHYHALLFGFDFGDKRFFKRGPDGSNLFTSTLLEELWPYGFASVGALTFESAAYCARYALKKVTGPGAASHYERVDITTGLCFSLVPEFVRMSLRPAIAKRWFQKFHSDVFPSDQVVARGHAMKPPRYYEKLMESTGDPGILDVIKRKRMMGVYLRPGEGSPRRLAVKHEVKQAAVKLFKREPE